MAVSYWPSCDILRIRLCSQSLIQSQYGLLGAFKIVRFLSAATTSTLALASLISLTTLRPLSAR